MRPSASDNTDPNIQNFDKKVKTSFRYYIFVLERNRAPIYPVLSKVFFLFVSFSAAS